MSAIILEVIDSDKTISNNIAKEIKIYVEAKLKVLTERLTREVKIWVVNVVKNSPTWRELEVYDDLRFELGLGPAEAAALKQILAVWEESVIVTVTSIGIKSGELSVEIEIRAIEASYEDVMTLAKYTSHGKEGPKEVDWLRWLLTRGGEAILKGYISYYVDSEYSRTGAMLMRKTGDENIPYYIPDSHQGTLNDNFVTRAIYHREKEFVPLMERTFAQIFT